MNCPNCGNPYNEGTKFCTSCGTNLANANATPTINPVTPQHIIQEETNQQENINNNIEQTNITEGVNNSINQNISYTPNVNINNVTPPVNNTIVTPNINTTMPANNTNNVTKPKANKKIIFIVVGAVIALIAIIVIVLLCTNGKGLTSSANITLSDELSPSKPIPITKDGKYGYMSKDGKLLLEPIYNSVSEFYGDYAVVTVENPDTTAKNKDLYQIIDTDGNNKTPIEIYSEPKYFEEYKIWVLGDDIYDDKLNKISPDNLELEYLGQGYFVWRDRVSGSEASGIMNAKGEITFTYKQKPNEYKYVMYDISENHKDFKETYCRVNISNDEYGIVNCDTGALAYRYGTNYVFVDKNNVFRIYKDHTFDEATEAYIQNDKIIYQTTTSDADIDYNYHGYMEVEENGKTKYIDIKTGKITTTNQNQTNPDLDIDEDDLADELTYGYRTLYESGKYGLITGTKVVIAPEFDDVEFLNSTLFDYIKKEKKQELVLFEKDGKTILFDIKSKKAISTFNSTSITDYNDSTFLKIAMYEDYSVKNYQIYNIVSGKSITVSKEDKLTINSNYVIVETKETKTYYNTDLVSIYQEEVKDNVKENN